MSSLAPRQQRYARSPLWLAIALVTAASGVMAAETTAAKAPTPALNADNTRDLFRYLVNSGALSLTDAQRLLDQMRTDQSKKSSEDLLRYLINSKALSVSDVQRLIDQLRTGKPDQSAPTATPAPAPAVANKPATATTTAAPVTTTTTSAVVVPTPTTTAAPVTATTATTTVNTPAVPAANANVSANTPVATPAPQPVEPAGRIRAVYLPESERQRIREEIKADVLAAAKKENWIQVDAAPEWTKRIRLSGEFMFRAESDLFDKKNSYNVINYQKINSGDPLNLTLPQGTAATLLAFPYVNTVENRSYLKLRARLNAVATVADDVETGFRFTTGNTENPVSANQTLGTDFNKMSVVLDRAWLRYHPSERLAVVVGKIPNPWLAPTELVWDHDLGFDGVSTRYQYQLTAKTQVFTTAGVFNIESMESNFPSKSILKLGGHNKWLYGAQIGGTFKPSSTWDLRSGLAYYSFSHLQGQVSSVCYAPNKDVACDTDYTKPYYMQKGNTIMALRNLDIVNPGTDPAYQYYGLAQQFRLLEWNFTLDQALTGTLHSQFDLDVVKNLAFNNNVDKTRAIVNNQSGCASSSSNCQAKTDAGDMGFQLQYRLGYPQIRERGQWSAQFGYRRVESDAVVDAFTDSDFHLGGTNAKGYYLGGSYGIAHNTWLNARWLSATEVTSDPFAVDVLQLDVNARF